MQLSLPKSRAAPNVHVNNMRCCNCNDNDGNKKEKLSTYTRYSIKLVNLIFMFKLTIFAHNINILAKHVLGALIANFGLIFMQISLTYVMV